MARKTFNVAEYVGTINAMLINTPDDWQDRRWGMIHALEYVLHDSGNYLGFGYLDEYQMTYSNNGKSVGIIRDEVNGNKYPDETRRRYSFNR